jgi:hypothetical protein
MMPLSFDPDIHQYTLDGVVLPSVTQVLQGVGLINFDGIDPQILQQAADFGTQVHRMTALDDIGDLDEQSLDDNLKPYLDAWRRFRGGMKFDAIEQPLCHPGYVLAGCPDRIAGNTIIDIKTSGASVPQWVGLQLSGYSILADIPAAKRIAVQLRGDGKFKVTEFMDRKDREVFLSCLTAYKWKIKNS